jgi:type II secretory pathway pseudopilin PulG
VTRAARGRRRSGGFTLIELTVSLVAGLIVAMAVMGVSKEATNTFHEEIRVSGAEMGLRVALERIRLDLQRAAFMGTGNLIGDPMIAHAANFANPAVPVNLSNFVGGTLPYSLANLSGVAVYPHAATAGGMIAVPSVIEQDAVGAGQLAAQPGGALLPDVIDIAGNMSSSDEYAAAIIPAPAAVPNGCAPTAAIQLEMTSPAGWRIRNAEANGSGNPTFTPGSALQAAFHPGTGTSAFLIRVTDQSGRYQYVEGCPGGIGVATAWSNPGGGVLPTAMVYISKNSSLLTTNQTGGLGGIAGFGAGLVTVSPLQITRWSIQSAAQMGKPPSYYYGATLNAAGTAVDDPTNFLLTRSYVDLNNCGTGAPCGVDTTTTEIISEYAVDLRFGLTVDTNPNANCMAFPCPTNAPPYNANWLTGLPMDVTPLATMAPYAAVENGATPNSYVVGQGPQRIRDVQVRIGIRSPFGDRALNLPVPQDTALPTGYIYRYFLTNASTHYIAATPYARVREATTEVNLPNQTRFYW